MHLRLISWFFIILNFMEYIGSQNASRGRRQRRMHPNVSQGCQGGCATCSDYNGCLSCKPKLFFVLERIGMKQIGVCLSSCPSGYYGIRYPDINKCTKCKADCDTCFNKNFCTKCKNGFYLHLGKCLDNCPEGLEANNHTMECVSIAHCEAGEWGPWSPCAKKGKTCGFKRGTETRVREITQHPSTKGNLCPPTSETRKCTVQRKKCQKGERVVSSMEVVNPLKSSMRIGIYFFQTPINVDILSSSHELQMFLLASRMEKKEGREKGKKLIKKKIRTQYLITKVWNLAEKLQNNKKTKTNSSRRSGRSKINNRNRYQSALYTRRSHEIFIDS
ncbi:R-spondin-3 isoform X1 [Manis javanica]|uniref:R-spondin-3 isoform X1 n=1 Tax=Manis javanica TaxID=9974 RepID=UPI003C6CDB93